MNKKYYECLCRIIINSKKWIGIERDRETCVVGGWKLIGAATVWEREGKLEGEDEEVEQSSLALFLSLRRLLCL